MSGQHVGIFRVDEMGRHTALEDTRSVVAADVREVVRTLLTRSGEYGKTLPAYTSLSPLPRELVNANRPDPRESTRTDVLLHTKRPS
jgi:hypothetical protein